MPAARLRLPPVDCPPPEAPAWIPRLKVKPSQRIQVALASKTWIGYETHFVEGRTLPCVASVALCQHCKAGFRKLWTGYTGVCLPRSLKPYLLMWYAGAHHACPALKERQGKLRPHLVTLSRLGECTNSPLRIEWDNAEHPGSLPVLLDVRVYLGRLWGIDLVYQE